MEQLKHILLEMATINRKSDILSTDKYKIQVLGNDRTPMTPHYHFLANDESFHIEIAIQPKDGLKIVHAKHRISIDKDKWLTWEGLRKEKELLRKWLDESNKVRPSDTNYEAIVYNWNFNNPDNEI